MIRMVLTGLSSLEIEPMKENALVPGPDEVLLDVLACAICRTDAKMWEQGQRDLILPRVPGHEVAVRDRQGRYFTVWPGKSCGTCAYCRNGRENLCEEMKITGFHNDGGFAHQMIAPKESLIPLPDGMDPVAACFSEPVGCVVNCFEKLPDVSGQRVLIFGGGTMGLICALYAKWKGFAPLVLEKHEDKINRVAPFISACDICVEKDSHDSEFEVAINACPDYIAFCQSLVKTGKAGHICFFSGISKNENIETNLLNLIHYKEMVVTGAYGMKKNDMEKAIPFIEAHEKQLRLLVEDIVPPGSAPALMANVLSGKHLKYILDFSGELHGKKDGGLASVDVISPEADAQKTPRPQSSRTVSRTESALCHETISGITPLDQALLSRAVAKMDDKSKPLGALGRLEDIGVRMSLIQNTLHPKIRRKAMLVFAGDHGITEEGISAYPTEVTGQMVDNFLNGGASINVFCRHHEIEMKIVDLGVIKEFSPHPDLIMAKVAKGTKNFALQAAMTRQEMVLALENAMKVFFDLNAEPPDTDPIDRPIDILGLGEVGIGNTTSAAAIICAATGFAPADAAGRGTGLDNKGLTHKIEVLEKVLQFQNPDSANGLEILQKLGGFEIAGMAGAALAAASKGCAVVLDGVISTAAGLIAYLINPDIKEFLIAGHKSVERAQSAALFFMGLEPVVDFSMRVGEGTGAALAIDAADLACKIMSEMASFDEAKISRSKRPS